MAEYIEREALIKRIANVKMSEVVPNCYEPAIKNAVCKQGQAFKKIINDQPTADVVEVRHGVWLDVPYPNNPNWKPRKRCSICGRFVRRKTENYCPDCGAKMDGKDGAE